jgi:DHA1 family bicyclomycin/chloramphenicol resistance-like MFS transporter
MRDWGARRLLLRASMTGIVLVLVAAALLANWSQLVIFQLFSMSLFCLSGLLLAPAAATALDAAAARAAGSAAGMLGMLQLVITAADSAVVSLFQAFSLTPLLTVLGGALMLATALSLATGGPPVRPAHSAGGAA